MKKKLIILGILGLMPIYSTYAADKVIISNAEQSNVYLEEARNLTRKSDFINAEKKLNEAIKLNNKNAYAFYELGQIEIKKNNNDKAINYFMKAIQIDPDKEEFYISKGKAEATKYQLKAVIHDMNKVIEINPKNGQAYTLLAAIYGGCGYTEQALEYVNKAIQYNKTSLDILYEMSADLKIRLRNYDGAIVDYNKAIIEVKNGTASNTAQKIEYLKQRIFEIQEAKKAFI